MPRHAPRPCPDLTTGVTTVDATIVIMIGAIEEGNGANNNSVAITMIKKRRIVVEAVGMQHPDQTRVQINPKEVAIRKEDMGDPHHRGRWKLPNR